jgi:hypothetical protein
MVIKKTYVAQGNTYQSLDHVGANLGVPPSGTALAASFVVDP